MKIKLSLRRSEDRETDLRVTVDATATVADVAGALFASDPDHQGAPHPGPVTLHVSGPGGGRTLEPAVNVLDAGLRSGSTVTVVRHSAEFAPGSQPQGRPAGLLRVLSGPDRDREFPLRQGSNVVGRSPGVHVRLTDPLVSREHIRVNVGADVDVVDLNSANGVQIGGSRITRSAVTSEDVVVIGDTELCLVALPDAGDEGGATAEVPVTRSPRVLPGYRPPTLQAPEPPERPQGERLPWIAMLAPLVMGVVLYLFTRSMLSVVFVAMSPLLMLGTWWDSRVTGRRRARAAGEQFDRALIALGDRLDREHQQEREVRCAVHPSVVDTVGQALRLGPLLWTRRPEHRQFMSLRLGLGSAPSLVEVSMPSANNTTAEHWDALERVVTDRELVDDVPIVTDLRVSGSLGIAGPAETADPVTAALMAQIVALHSPAEVVVTSFVSAARRSGWAWLAWLPHTSSPHSPLTGSHLAADPAAGNALLSQLEEVVAQRLTHSPEEGVTPRGDLEDGQEEVEHPVLPSIVVLVEDGASVERARLSRLTEQGPDAGVHVVWVAPHVSRLPGACRTYLDLRLGPEHAVVAEVRRGRTTTPVVVEQLAIEEAERVSRALGPLVDAEVPVDDDSDLPRRVSYLALAGRDLGSQPSSVIERWQQSGSLELPQGGFPRRKGDAVLRGLIGHAGSEPLFLDLRTQGPHALVGGTTGAGKSEFLQSWVLGMASAYSPRRLTFLFVDYKGGAAFAECTELPHCVGLVTDLSPHLVRRALTSLRAELHHREHILNLKKAKDLLALERTGDPEAPPALVIVVDEFAALAKEVPEFVDGVVDIAQRGRSLGLHLILATQRPAGVIKDSLRANTNLRVALRMNDADDSTDILGLPLAADIDPSLPGRGAVRTGPGRVTAFQTAYAGGWTTDEPPRPRIEVAELGFGAATTWEVPEPEQVDQGDPGPTDIARMVRTMIVASSEVGLLPPRRPWLDELAPVYRLDQLSQRTDTALVIGICDDPTRQEQYTTHFHPDSDGNIAIFGTGGSGKSTTLRTLAAAAGIHPRGGPIHVYGLDFGSRGLAMLEDLPHVGAVITGDDSERVGRLLRWLRDLIDERAERYSTARAATIEEYRDKSSTPMEPRILLLVDSVGAFRDAYDVGVSNNVFAIFEQIAVDGRPVGVHLAMTADRPGALPPSVRSTVQRRLVLRLADENDYSMLDVSPDILGPGSPPGRGVLDGLETQVAVLGSGATMTEQSKGIRSLAATNRAAAVGRTGDVRGVESLPDDIPLSDVPVLVDGQPVIGVESDTLSPWGLAPEGIFLVAGPPASGRSTALAAIAASFTRGLPTMRRVYVGHARSAVHALPTWQLKAGSPAEAVTILEELRTLMDAAGESHKVLLVVENLPSFLGTEAENLLETLVPRLVDHGHLVIAETELSKLSQYGQVLTDIKAARRGIVLQPDQGDGDSVLRTEFPRVSRKEFPPGRGLVADRGKVYRLQLIRP